jgi:soluble lytic murein transglycosylase-like protein
LSHGCSISRSPITRIVAAVVLFALPITASFCFETTASGQNLSRVESIERLAEFNKQASDRFSVPARWISAVIQIESAGGEHAISSRDAMGLMQLMPGTWVELSVRYDSF